MNDQPVEAAPMSGRRETDPDAKGLLDAIEEHDQAVAARPRIAFRVRRSRTPIVMGLAVLFVASSAWHISHLTDSDTFTPAETEADAIFSVLIAIDAIEDFRAEEGELPPSLEAVEADSEGLVYEIVAGAYQLYLRFGPGEVMYGEGDSVEPLESRLLGLVGGGPG